MTKTIEPSSPRLTHFRVKADPIGRGPTWHSLSLVDVANPPPQLEGWTVAIRGAVVLFVSPRGWEQGTTARKLDGDITVIEIPRSDVRLVWAMGDVGGLEKLQRADVGPLVRIAQPMEVAAAIDSKEMGDA